MMATSRKIGAKMSLKFGLSVGGCSGCRAGDLRRGCTVFRLVRKGFGHNWRIVGRGAAGNSAVHERIAFYCDNLREWKFWGPQRQSRFRDVVFRLQDLSCSPAWGGRTLSKFAGYVPVRKCPHNSPWPLFSHRLGESPRIISSNQQGGPADNTDPPPLFMGNQMKRFSHFRDGIVHWCSYLEVKKDVRNHGQEQYIRDEECSSTVSHLSGDASRVALDNDLSNLTVICFDIETTGFSPYYHRIIEFAARDLAGGVCSTMETLVNPEREVKNEHVHNISSRMVNNPGVPKWRDVALALVDFVESRRKSQGLVILVAHNGKRFDVPFIMSEFYACGISIPSYWRFADSMALAKLAMKGSGRSPLPKTALGELFNYYNLPSLGKAHRAMADVNMLAQVLQMLMNDLEMSTSELLEQSFSSDDVVLKSKNSLPSRSDIVSKGELDARRPVKNWNDSGPASVPWE